MVKETADRRGVSVSGRGPKWSRIPYREDPDYTKPLLEIPAEARERMFARLRFLYGEDKTREAIPELERILRVHHAHKSQELIEAENDFDPKERFTEKDMVLITYGDMVEGEEHSPLANLHKFVATINRGAINTLHLLPFFPYSSNQHDLVERHQWAAQSGGHGPPGQTLSRIAEYCPRPSGYPGCLYSRRNRKLERPRSGEKNQCEERCESGCDQCPEVDGRSQRSWF